MQEKSNFLNGTPKKFQNETGYFCSTFGLSLNEMEFLTLIRTISLFP